jgi:hypothetical protein
MINGVGDLSVGEKVALKMGLREIGYRRKD